jgi:hypothetical protein
VPVKKLKHKEVLQNNDHFLGGGIQIIKKKKNSSQERGLLDLCSWMSDVSLVR